MGNVVFKRLKCFDCANADQRQRRSVTVLLVGLDNAGKTSTVKCIMKEKQKPVLPTIGFSSSKFNYLDSAITVYDLGGHKQIRDIWEQYFPDVHGVIFVVDSSDHRRMDECKEVFQNLLGHANIAGKPVLLLANKQDKLGALDELDVVDRLNVEAVVNANKCPTLVETCTTFRSTSSIRTNCCRSVFIDPSIDSGFNWLVSHIVKKYDTLNHRVTEDMTKYKSNVNRKMEEWKKKQQTSNDSYLLSFNAPQRRSTRRNPFRHINKVIDSFESKTSNVAGTDLTGSTSYIIPLRSESDEDYEPPAPMPEPVAFRNRVAPATDARAPRPEPAARSRSPLFRAKSGARDHGSPERAGTCCSAAGSAEAVAGSAEAVTGSVEAVAGSTDAAKTKRSVFGNKSNSAGASGSAGAIAADRRPTKPGRSTGSAKSLRNGIRQSFQSSADKKVHQLHRSDKSYLDNEDVMSQRPGTSSNSPEIIGHM